jgi:cyclohexanone monooxygenase
MATVDASDYDIVIVGAGFAGMYSLYKLRGEGHRVRVFEAGTGVGGVWYWNRYPGARVDVESLEYSFTFSADLERDWKWSEQYSSQAELEAYANHVADRFDLRRDIQLETRVTAAVFDEDDGRWIVSTDRGDRVSARFVVMASGSLSVPKDIDLPGIERFKGELYRTSQWPREHVEFAGKRVGEIGTGSSGIQIIPVIAEQAAHLTVFQRTAGFSMPSRNGPTNPAVAKAWFDNRDEMHRRQRRSPLGLVLAEMEPRSALDVSEEERRAAYEARWEKGGVYIIGAFNDLLFNKDSNETCAEFVREKIRAVVDDPEVAAKLVPNSHPIFTKRPCVDSGYYQTFNRDNVALVDVRETPIETVTETGIRAGGKDYEFDMLVLAIGFDAMTGAMTRIDIRGRGGVRLKDVWDGEGPNSYLGLAIAGFPNMFMIAGPGSPSVLGNMMGAFEENAAWIADCVAYMNDRQLGVIEVDQEAQDVWMAEVKRAAELTLYTTVDSWYTGANVPGKKRAFTPYLGGWSNYLDTCDDVAAQGYRGFRLSATGSGA